MTTSRHFFLRWYNDLTARSITLGLYDVECWFLDIETVVRVKRAVCRPKDLEALAELEGILDEE